ncbi:MAG: quinoprotein dehydrogenase-associated SoxYZ-like carrier [Rhodobacteraceae bacterium]|jgi:sulfur-oxidizing protein SoxY|uniref:Sulfur-oxidizing protein SoxY n=1 Tax=Salipiger profundus TaxID=1229727 RepID=A0A1U7D365_9RHOB|nr:MULTISPECIES: quinoprotein dehydrogenase-associated SoxYZ-like carrier [Salipiger]APX22591.1 sulfur-oxidizing protein SoxY [Salipiger profundus]MAB06000.1 quinoprotein dehydrogenase-associated SoxYZ-like carrier [Paracoccaceae bacterium]GGA11059.1 quinoprotein dehydrogenase-associated SoxYZ-like carrier [Salipiger profundus]SFC67944.1 sulfur-oxidizing protein SoxY [Salipiger profundus]
MDHRSLTAALLAAALLASPLKAADTPNPLTDSPTWDSLRADVTGQDTPIPAADGLFTLDAPYRAEDAATVPLRIVQADPSVPIRAATVVIDENPAPVAGTFTFSEAMAPLDFEFRVRVNQYSNVRVIADTPGGLRMDGRFVKASGGCSAPATKDPEQALAGMGQMRLRLFGQEPAAEPAMSTPRREAQIMVRHPNYSGLQRDQITQLFIPAHFIDHLEVWQGEEQLFAMDGGISISENPAFRFSYDDNGAPALTVRATDTEGNRFETVLPKAGG